MEYPDTYVRNHNGLEKLSGIAKRARLTNPEGIVLRQWQQTIYDELQGPINSREIKWIYDSDGDITSTKRKDQKQKKEAKRRKRRKGGSNHTKNWNKSKTLSRK